MPGIRFRRRRPNTGLELKEYYGNEFYTPAPVWNWEDDPIRPGMEIKAAHIQSIRDNLEEKINTIRSKVLYCSCTCDTTCNCQCECTCTCTCTCDWTF